jgi:hypothetical protein
MEDALNVTRAGGTIVLLGNTARLDGVDWTPLWLKELKLAGSLAYGRHAHAGASVDAFEEAAGLIASRKLELARLVTHTFPLTQFGAALAVRSPTSSTRTCAESASGAAAWPTRRVVFGPNQTQAKLCFIIANYDWTVPSACFHWTLAPVSAQSRCAVAGPTAFSPITGTVPAARVADSASGPDLRDRGSPAGSRSRRDGMLRAHGPGRRRRPVLQLPGPSGRALEARHPEPRLASGPDYRR